LPFWRLVRPDAEAVWNSEKVQHKLTWYSMVMNDVAPAKFMIAKKVPIDFSPSDSRSLEELWEAHNSARKEFLRILDKARSGKLTLSEYKELPNPQYSFLDLKIELAWRIVKECRFCERRCLVDRSVKQGFCRLGLKSYVTTYFLHLGEEAPLVPSGTIFYGSCNFKCVYCQNYDISQENPYQGIEAGPKEIAAIQEYLRSEGARNINHVGGDPTPNIHNIVESLKYVRVNVPQLWNSNMYLTEEALTIIIDLIDIWLPDFKYGNNNCALRLSLADRYYDVVTRNMKIICFSGDPIIIRHLVLPNHINCCTKPVLEWIALNCRNALVNVMGQYRPEYLVWRSPEKYRDISRRPSAEEMEEAYKYAEKLGLDYEEVS